MAFAPSINAPRLEVSIDDFDDNRADASDLDLEPGVWPSVLIITDWNNPGRKMGRAIPVGSQSHPNGDLHSVTYYCSEWGKRFYIIND